MEKDGRNLLPGFFLGGGELSLQLFLFCCFLLKIKWERRITF